MTAADHHERIERADSRRRFFAHPAFLGAITGIVLVVSALLWYRIWTGPTP